MAPTLPCLAVIYFWCFSACQTVQINGIKRLCSSSSGIWSSPQFRCCWNRLGTVGKEVLVFGVALDHLLYLEHQIEILICEYSDKITLPMWRHYIVSYVKSNFHLFFNRWKMRDFPKCDSSREDPESKCHQ